MVNSGPGDSDRATAGTADVFALARDTAGEGSDVTFDGNGIIAVLLVWLLVIAISVRVSYLVIRGAVRAAVKGAISDLLADPETRQHVVDLIHPNLVAPQSAEAEQR
jgi:hypothetical protein